ncbi:MAG: hypothetical protein M5U12_36265 [Verrucomicrobia bacterium]|nr:hypothetical protein [Verrucomicrobiota bacterium]
MAGSLLLRLSLFDFESGDYRFFLSRWYDLYVEQGRWRGLGVEEPFATYPRSTSICSRPAPCCRCPSSTR